MSSPATGATTGVRERGRGVVAIVVTVLASAALWVAYVGIPASQGALGIPRNDDWTYYRSLFHLVETGRFEADPFARASMVGQLVAAAPVVAVFGRNIALIQVLAALTAVAAVVVVHRVVRRFLAPLPALLVATTFALSPLYTVLAATFMTDLSSVIVQVLAIAAGAAALRQERFRWGWWCAAAALAVWAFTIREYAVAAIVALALAAIWTRWRSDPARVVAAAVAMMGVALGLCVAFFLWRTNLPNAGVPGRVGQADPVWVLIQLLKAVFTLSLSVAPLAVLAVGRAVAGARRHPVAALGMIAAVLAAWIWGKTEFPGGLLLGNFVYLRGPYAETIHGQPPLVFARDAWLVVEVVAGVSTLLIGLAAVSVGAVALRRGASLARGELDPATTTPGHRTAVLCGLHGVTVVLVTLGVSILTDAPLFDRYLVPAIPGIAAALAHAARATDGALRPQRLVVVSIATVATLAHGAFGLVLANTASTFDGAKWELGNRVVAAGHPAREVDAGYEWWGLHQEGPIVGRGFGGQYGESLWIKLFADPRACVRSEYWTPEVPAEQVIAEIHATTWHGHTYHFVALPQDGTHYCPA